MHSQLVEALRLPSYFSLRKGMTSGNRVSLLRNGESAFPEMIRAIDAARSTINLEIYCIRSDETGWTFARHLAERARLGVEVNLIYDGFGSFGTSWEFFHYLESAGVRLLEFHPLFPWRRSWGWQKRDHRKMLIVDGEVGFTGGLNIGDEYAGDHGWRDTQVRIEGPAVREMQRLFLATWKRYDGRPLDPYRYFPAQPSNGEARHPVDDRSSLVQVMGNHEWKNRHRIRKSFLRGIREAKKSIHIAHAYFVPDRGIRRALRNAVRRGVEVTLLLPGVSDVLPIDYASRALYARFLCCGVRIFEWPHPVLHSKTVIIDRIWSSVGSYNIDHRSLFHNLEVIVNVYDEGFGERMEEAFAKDLSGSKEVVLSEWERRPLHQRALERFFYFFRYWL
jgi:cardiolipin synthase